ncbi:MAG: 5-histidylcysteine sulfoxide synthase [Campylobacterales bacterium]|nr:5-histidylcysteine sulfoxide synthase [Campylobacterales bacterium]
MEKNLITRNILLTGTDIEEKRSEILDYFLKTYETFERLFDCFVDDFVYYEQPEKLRHPIIFYYGHTASFYINKMIIGKYISERINPKFENMFAIGVDEMSWDDLDKENYSWPTVAQTREYRKQVKDVVVDYIKNVEFSLPINWESPLWVILMGIEHERIHIETSSVLHRQLDIKFMKEDLFWIECNEFGEAPLNELLPVKGGVVVQGKDWNDRLYGWDNEYGEKKTTVEDFKASKYLVSNGEFLEFVEEGGYENDSYWSEEGLNWKNHTKVTYPTFWVKEGDSFQYRTMTRVIPMAKNWPVDVNFLEAEAFCAWKSEKENKNITLPSEPMWYRLHEECQILDEPEWNEEASGNINLEHFASSCPVDRFRQGDFYDVVGNVWQWTTTPIDGFEGFKVHPLYDDFSVPTFDNRHNLIKGGSWISTGNEAIKDSRYAFRRHFYQHAGFRYVEVKKLQEEREDIYERDEIISQYCDFHYGDEHYGVKNFNVAIADLAKKYGKNRRKALDLGCNVGRAVFEMGKTFSHVTGIDFTTRLIQIGQRMINNGSIKYERKIQGENKELCNISLKDLGLDDLDLEKIEFWQGDACNLKPHFTGYDLIISANLIDRVYNPRKFLEDISHRLNDDGIFIIGSPFTWDESYTDKELWIGGHNGKDSQEALEEVLSKDFEKVKEPFEVEFVIREHQRKFQHSKSFFSVWKKR